MPDVFMMIMIRSKLGQIWDIDVPSSTIMKIMTLEGSQSYPDDNNDPIISSGYMDEKIKER